MACLLPFDAKANEPDITDIDLPALASVISKPRAEIVVVQEVICLRTGATHARARREGYTCNSYQQIDIPELRGSAVPHDHDAFVASKQASKQLFKLANMYSCSRMLANAVCDDVGILRGSGSVSKTFMPEECGTSSSRQACSL